MKGKNLSKVLALLLACVMIFTTLPLMAFASDEAETYTVSYGAPAIPMNEMTKVNLADISVEMERGTVVSGADITWAAAEQEGIEFDAAAKTVFAKTAGRYKLTATAAGVTKNIWVLVKTAEQEDFYLVNLPELNKNTVVADDWKLFQTKTGAVHTGAINATSSSYIASPTICLMVYVDEIFEDFADYTVEANMASSADSRNTSNVNRGAGLAGRVGLVDGAWNFNGIVTYIRQDYRINVRKPQATNSNAYFGEGRDVYEYDAEGNKILIPGKTSDYYTVPELKAWKNNSTYHIVKNVYSGTELEVFYDGESLGNSASYNDTKFTCRSQTAAGYPGVVGYESSAYLKSFAVKLNSNALAPAKEVNFYTVSYDTPAVPMNENTAVDLSLLNVEMDAEGTIVSGADITWKAQKNDAIYLNDAAKKVSVYAAGNYKLTATYNDVSKNVWIIAKKAEDTEFALIDYNFADGYNPADWQFVLWSSGSKPSVGYEADPAVNPGAIEYNTKNGYVAMGLNNNKQETLKWVNYGVLISKNPIFDDFADYTVTSTSSMRAGGTINGWGGPGIMGRVQLTDTGAIDNNHKAILAQFLGLGTVRVAVDTTTWWLAGHTNYTCDASYIKEDKGTIKNGEEGYNGHYYWTNTTSLNEYKILKGVYAGDNFALSIDETEVYNLSKASDADKTAWANDANHAVGAGAPGVFTWGGKIQVKTFKVTLNSNEMPNAIAAEEKPKVDRYVVESFDPVIVMYNNTSVLLDNIGVQFENGGKATVGTDIEWTAPETDGIEIIDGEEGKFIAYTNGTYVVTATFNGVSKKIYLIVTDKHEDEVVLFSDDFSEGELNYNIWQQTEYYWGEPVQVTSQKDKSDKYIEGVNVAQVGAIPFVTRDYWDALTLGGPHSREEAGGTGYNWSKIFMNNVQHYMYIREDYVTEDGIKLSELGVYDVSASFTTLDQGENIREYNVETDTYSKVRLDNSGLGIMGRINFAGQTFYNKSASKMQSFKWDVGDANGRYLIINDGTTSQSQLTTSGGTNNFGTGSMKVSYRAKEISGRYIPIGNSGTSSVTENLCIPSYSTQKEVSNGWAGSVGFYTDAHNIDIFDFTVTYPVNVPVYTDVEVTVENNTITVPVNTTVDLAKYTFMVNGVATKGNQVAWSGLRNEIGEIDAVNGTFTAFSVGTTTVNGVTFVVSDTQTTVGAKSLINVVGNGSVAIAPNGTSNSYAVQATADSGYLLKGGVITVTYADGTTKIVGVDATGKAIITVDHIGAISVDAVFTAKQEVGFVSLGATIRLPGTKDAAGNTLKPGIKFGARINNIRLTEGKATLDAEVTLGGKDYKIEEIGSLVIPTQLLYGEELTVNSERVQRKPVSVVSNATENFADITAVLVGIPQNWYGTEVSFRGYMKLISLDDTGELYVYTDEIERSYNGVMKAAPVTATGVKFNADNTTIMLTSAKANLKYAIGEEMIVNADTYIDGTMANGISLTYKVFKGDANGYSGDAIAVGSAKSSATASVKLSYIAEKAGYYYVVVSALDKDGNTVIADTIRLGAGLVSASGTKVFDENNIALNFGVASDTHIMGEYMNYRSNRHLISLLKVLNNQAGYYADGTQKLDALLVAGDLTNAVMGATNLNGLPGWKSADTVAKFDYLIYSEVNAFRNIMNNYLGDTQLFYCLGNHDTTGGEGASFKYGSYMFRPTLYYQQILSGKRVELPAAVVDMTPEQISAVHFNVNDDYTDSKEYIKYYGRDEESAQNFNQGNRIMHINGYTFVAIDAMVLQNGFARYTDATLKFLKDALDESVAKDPSAPVFVITHYRPYGTEAYQVDLPYNGARNIDELLQNYPQAILWGGHKHVPLQTETSIIQTRTVDENGNVIESGYTSLTSAASAYGSADKFGDPNNQEEGSYTQLVQVDINGNIKITRYYISSDTEGQACETTGENEVVKGADGQWIKSWTDNSSAVVTKVKTINDPWFIVNSVDDNVRDEYAPDTRAALSQPKFISNEITVSGKKVTFPKAVNALGVNNAESTIVQYRAYLYDADGNLVEKKDISRFINRYTNYYDVPDNDTYSVTFTGSGTRVVIRAFDTWACFFDHSKYPTIEVNVNF